LEKDKNIIAGDIRNGQNLGDRVNLVDVLGNVTSTTTKLDAHSGTGQLHLAFSVMLFTEDGEVLLQKRAEGKYHFPGKWANACCSHPKPDEELFLAAKRRLSEELGLETELKAAGNFIYRAVCEQSNLVEYEFDHVLLGVISRSMLWQLNPSPSEVEDMALANLDTLSSTSNVVIEESLLLHKKYELSHRDMAPWLLPALSVVGEYKK